jgi:hypothetical protein
VKDAEGDPLPEGHDALTLESWREGESLQEAPSIITVAWSRRGAVRAVCGWCSKAGVKLWRPRLPP